MIPATGQSPTTLSAGDVTSCYRYGRNLVSVYCRISGAVADGQLAECRRGVPTTLTVITPTVM